MTEVDNNLYEFKAHEYGTNLVLRLNAEVDWYVSYAPNPFMGSGPETALYWVDDSGQSHWYILNGDWRTEYVEAMPDLEKCKQVFLDNKEKHLCDWSVE